MNTSRLLRHGREHLSAWLPAILMAFFALGSWWLVRSAPQLAPQHAPPPAAHESDYEMRDFMVRNFSADGELTSELTGQQAQHYPDSDTMEVTEPRMRSYDDNGNPTVGRAKRGISNADGSEIKLYDNAEIVREALTSPTGKPVPRMEFRGNYLDVFTQQQRVQSDQRVHLFRGPDEFSGNRFDYDKKSGIAHLEGDVRGVIQPVTEE